MICIMAGAGRSVLCWIMKPSIPDIGTVIRLEGPNAVVRMKHEGSCSKCGAAAIGLCKGGMMQVVTVRNIKRACVGDTVKIGLVQGTQNRGYLLAYVVPAAALIVGISFGHVLAGWAGFPPLDIIAGFSLMIAASFFSLRRLKRLASVSSIEIVQVLTDPWTPGDGSCAEENSVADYYASYY